MQMEAWCSGESCFTESPGRGFEAASPRILRGEGLPRFFPSPDPTHVGASGIGSALFFTVMLLRLSHNCFKNQMAGIRDQFHCLIYASVELSMCL